MSVVEKTCFVVACDRCGDPYEEGDGPHTPVWRVQADYTFRF